MLFTIGLVLMLAAAITLLIIWRMLLSQGLISRALNLTLIAVRFSPSQPPQEPNLQQVREKIGLMEQLYAQLAFVRDSWWRTLFYGRPTFALELCVPSVGEEITFYLGVSRRLSPSVQKIIQGVFPDSHIEESRDYNIFNPDGVASGSFVIAQKGYYPIRTYQKLEGDPLRAITNVFTKLAHTGEGAALQIIARPARKKWAKKLKKRAKKLFAGHKDSAGDDPVMKAIHHVISIPGPSAPMHPQTTPAQPIRLTPLEEEMVKALEGKSGKILFEANIRLLASGADAPRTQVILQSLEAAFHQFTDPNLGGLAVKRTKPNGLKKLVFAFSFRTFDESRALVLGTDELTSIFHFPNLPIETPKLRSQKAKAASSPANLPTEGLLLGYNDFRGEKSDIRILDEDRRRHLYIIGQTGTGKSAFLQNLIAQDIEQGKGVSVIDPHGDLVETILSFVPRHRMQDVVYFDPGDVARPMGLNMLEYDPDFPEQKTFIVNELLSIFDKLYNMSVAGGPMFEQYFRNATLLVMEHPASGNTLLEIQRVLTDKPYRDFKLAHTANVVVKNFWQQIAEKAGGEASLQNIVPYIASKFDNFVANDIMRPIIAQEKSAFSFREVMDSQKILLVNLSKGRLGDLNSSLIGLIIVGKLLMAALSRVAVSEEKRKDFYLYIDEFQNVTTTSIATILSEARKYRLDLTITHQFIGQLKDEIKKAVFGNVGSMISFRIGSDDAEFMTKQYKPIFSEQDLLNIDNYNCYLKLLINGATSPPFSMKTYTPKKGDAEMVTTIKEISRQKYGRPREDIEREIIERSEKVFE